MEVIQRMLLVLRLSSYGVMRARTLSGMDSQTFLAGISARLDISRKLSGRLPRSLAVPRSSARPVTSETISHG